jgi:hypothetical protein
MINFLTMRPQSIRNRNRDVNRRVRDKSRRPSPKMSRQIKRYRVKTQRTRAVRDTRVEAAEAAESDEVADDVPDVHVHRGRSPLDRAFRQLGWMATDDPPTWADARLQQRLAAGRQHEQLDRLERNVCQLNEFVQSPYAHMVDCMLVSGQFKFFLDQSLEIHYDELTRCTMSSRRIEQHKRIDSIILSIADRLIGLNSTRIAARDAGLIE